MSIGKRLTDLEAETRWRRVRAFFGTLTDEALASYIVALQWPEAGRGIPTAEIRATAADVRRRLYEYATPAERRDWWPPEELQALAEGRTLIEELPIDTSLPDPLLTMYGDSGVDREAPDYEPPRPPWAT